MFLKAPEPWGKKSKTRPTVFSNGKLQVTDTQFQLVQ